jgi:hypothetical protein
MERKLLNSLSRIAVLSITALTPLFVHASDASVEQIRNLVADVFSYPVEKLKITPKDAPNGRSSFGVESDDGTFFPVTLDVAKRGSLLKPQLEAQLMAMIEKAASEPKEGKNGIRKVQLRDQAYAYFGIGAGGPGGSQSTAVFVFPKSESEVAITVSASREDNINIEASPQEYQTLMSENNPDMMDRMARLAEKIAAITNVSDGSQSTGSASSAQQTPVRSVPFDAPDGAEADKETTTPMSPSIVQAEPPKSTPWPWIFGAILLLAVAGGILFKLRRK